MSSSCEDAWELFEATRLSRKSHVFSSSGTPPPARRTTPDADRLSLRHAASTCVSKCSWFLYADHLGGSASQQLSVVADQGRNGAEWHCR